MSIESSSKYKTVSIPEELGTWVEQWIINHPEYGYKTVAEFFKEAARFRIKFDKLEEIETQLKTFKEESKLFKTNTSMQISDENMVVIPSISMIEKGFSILNQIGSKLGIFSFKFISRDYHLMSKIIQRALFFENFDFILSFQRLENIKQYKLTNLVIDMIELSQNDTFYEKYLKGYIDGVFYITQLNHPDMIKQFRSDIESLIKNSEKNTNVFILIIDNKNILNIEKDLEQFIIQNKNIVFKTINDIGATFENTLIEFLERIIAARTNKDSILFPNEKAQKIITDLYGK